MTIAKLNKLMVNNEVLEMPATMFEIKKTLDNELLLCPGRWERLGEKKWYSLEEIKQAINKVGKKVGINAEKGCWQCPLIDELEKK